MKQILALYTAACAAGVWAAMPVVSEIAVSDQDANGVVTITYNLDSAAIVTAEILVNDVAVPPSALSTLSGAVNRKVPAKDGLAISWSPLAAGYTGAGKIKALLTAWSLDNPPDYLAVDLSVANSRRYYTSEAMIPGGLVADVNKRDVMIMRKIPAEDVVWRMGQPYPDGENCQIANSDGNRKADILNNETGHMVKLTNDYYMAVYPMTQGQYVKLVGNNPSYYKVGDSAPVDTVSFDALRGSPSGAFYSWPRSKHDVAPGSLLSDWRTFTGILSLDLPTEAEWEYACRAGTGSALNNGKECANPSSGADDANLNEVGWGNWSEDHQWPVGGKRGNNWGLYDMHANIQELCLDWWCGGEDYRATFAAGWGNGAVTVAPVGPENADGSLPNRIVRGGSSGKWYSSSYCRSASRIVGLSPSATNRYVGFRLICRTDLEK